MNSAQLKIDAIVTQIQRDLEADRPPDEPLSLLRAETNSRAVGLWQNSSEFLHLLGFSAAPNMPADVQSGFCKATRKVPLSKTDLGIVKAAVQRKATIATVGSSSGILSGSATWLERFEAINSLAVPIGDAEDVRGVLAMSTAVKLHPDEPSQQLLTLVADALAPIMGIK